MITRRNFTKGLGVAVATTPLWSALQVKAPTIDDLLRKHAPFYFEVKGYRYDRSEHFQQGVQAEVVFTGQPLYCRHRWTSPSCFIEPGTKVKLEGPALIAMLYPESVVTITEYIVVCGPKRQLLQARPLMNPVSLTTGDSLSLTYHIDTAEEI